jgi:hypothetical protein
VPREGSPPAWLRGDRPGLKRTDAFTSLLSGGEVAGADQKAHRAVIAPNRQAPQPCACAAGMPATPLAATDFKRVTFAGRSLGDAFPPVAPVFLIA